MYIEKVDVMVAIHLWTPPWANQKVHPCFDNQAVVKVHTYDKARDSIHMCQECLDSHTLFNIS